MGLDMYLEKGKKEVFKYEIFKGMGINELMTQVDTDKLTEKNPEIVREMKEKGLIVSRGKYSTWDSFTEDIGYWRKSNQIHNWFVENVQGGVDDCGYYEVKKEDLEDLLDVCKKVLNISVIGKDYKEIEILLPTQSGFFFGGVEYNDYYFEGIQDTIEIIENALKNIDFDEEFVVYTSSW